MKMHKMHNFNVLIIRTSDRQIHFAPTIPENNCILSALFLLTKPPTQPNNLIISGNTACLFSCDRRWPGHAGYGRDGCWPSSPLQHPDSEARPAYTAWSSHVWVGSWSLLLHPAGWSSDCNWRWEARQPWGQCQD